MNIVLFAEYGGELILEFLKDFRKHNVEINSIVLIGDKYDENRSRLVVERTKNLYHPLSFIETLDERILPCYFVDDVNSAWTERVLKSLKPDLVVSGCTKIIKRPIWEIPKYGMLNCHTGFVQQYRGCSCVEWAIYHDDPVGASCLLIDKGIDTGDLVYQAPLYIRRGDEYPLVRAKVIKLMATVMRKGVEKILKNQNGFSTPFEKGRYCKPMKDQALINKVVSKLKNQEYTHYELPHGIDVSLK